MISIFFYSIVNSTNVQIQVTSSKVFEEKKKAGCTKTQIKIKKIQIGKIPNNFLLIVSENFFRF